MKVIYHDSNRIVVRTPGYRLFICEHGVWRNLRTGRPATKLTLFALDRFLDGLNEKVIP